MQKVFRILKSSAQSYVPVSMAQIYQNLMKFCSRVRLYIQKEFGIDCRGHTHDKNKIICPKKHTTWRSVVDKSMIITYCNGDAFKFVYKCYSFFISYLRFPCELWFFLTN